MTSMAAQSPGMSVEHLRARMAANGVKTGYALAKLLGVSPSTTSRWLRSVTSIDASAAALIREKLPKKPKG